MEENSKARLAEVKAQMEAQMGAAFAADDIEGICDLRDLREMPGKLSRLVELALPHAAPMK